MAPDRQPVIRGEYHVSIVGFPARLQRIEHPADLFIHVRDDRKIFRAVNPHHRLAAGMRS